MSSKSSARVEAFHSVFLPQEVERGPKRILEGPGGRGGGKPRVIAGGKERRTFKMGSFAGRNPIPEPDWWQRPHNEDIGIFCMKLASVANIFSPASTTYNLRAFLHLLSLPLIELLLRNCLFFPPSHDRPTAITIHIIFITPSILLERLSLILSFLFNNASFHVHLPTSSFSPSVQPTNKPIILNLLCINMKSIFFPSG